METVFHASVALDAHLVQQLLERAGIPSRIDGEYLQGAAGELPPGSLVRVRVAPEQAAEAREIIAEWEKLQPDEPLSTPPAKRKSSWAPYTWVLGLAMGFAAAWIHYNTPITRNAVDYNDDGNPEERYVYAGIKMQTAEFDRNSDGRVDMRYEYDSHGVPTQTLIDDDFDGRFETHVESVRGQWSRAETDSDGDGFFEEITHYANGIRTQWEYLSPTSHKVLKKSQYRGELLIASEYDADGDGEFERRVEYDEMGDPRPVR